MRAVWRVLCLVVCALVARESAFAAEPTRPNILFLLVDDQRADTIAALGNPVIRTPNLDRLAEAGFAFRNAYCFGSNMPAVCTPSRNMLLSGRTYFRYPERLAPADGPNLPRALREAGYETWHYGKRGNTATEIQKSFEHNQYLKDEEDRTSGEPGQTIADSAIQFLEKRDAGRPFFMLLAFANPHDPRVAAAKYHEPYREGVPLPANYLPVHPFDNGEMTIRDEELAAWPRTKEEIGRHLQDYYATITGLDHHIGRVLDALEKAGQREKTIILFTSDHGLAIGSHGLMGKQSLYEHSMKSPLIVAGPGVPQGASDALVYLHDLFPTICELGGATTPGGLDGASLVDLWQGNRQRIRDTLFTAYRDAQRSVRDERYKLIRYPRINRTQLFDLASDPDERRDLANEADQQERVAKLLAEMARWQKELGDDLPLTAAEPRDSTFQVPAKSN